MFRRFGVKRVTVEEIAREAGVSKVTFYKYFANKNELVKYILRSMTERALARTEEVQHMDIPFPDKVRQLIDDKLRDTTRTSEAFIDEFFHTDDEELRVFVRELTRESHRRFLDFVTASQKQGHVRPSIRPAFVLAILGKLNELAADEELKRHYPDYVELTREIIDFFFYGLLTPQERCDEWDKPGAHAPSPGST